MSILTRLRAIPLGFIGVVAAGWLVLAAPQKASAELAIRWIGQDEHDLVGLSVNPGKSGIQDLHFVMSGLPPRVKVASAIVHGEGDGEWKFNGPPNSWLALFAPRASGGLVDVWMEPYRAEPGRAFIFDLTFEDGRKLTITCRGGRADQNLRMPGTGIESRWIGQDKHDRCGPTENPGPDGVQDVHIALNKLAAKDEVKSILVVGPHDLKWQYARNPEAYLGAEFLRNPSDATRGDLYFQPMRDLAGQKLKVTVTYMNNLVDTTVVKASKTDPALKMQASPVVTVEKPAIESQWIGQEANGDVRVILKGLPKAGRVSSIGLSDGVVGGWSDKPSGDLLPLTLRPAGEATTAELRFPPVRDETGATMSLIFQFEGNRVVVCEFPGGNCDPSLRAPAPAATSTKAKPGDDLQQLVSQFGTVELGPGEYPLSKPLVLDKPVTLTANGDATLLFTQPASSPIWTTAIKIHAGRTTLNGFKIRFSGPVRWDQEVSYGPSIIGTTDARDKPTGNVLAGLTFTKLDVVGPQASTAWEETPRILRMVGATNGVVEGNVFKGGIQEFFGGPWTFVGNRHDGTPQGTFTYTVASFHAPHDLLVARNRVKTVEKNTVAKTWRWLVLTNRGENIRVSENVTEGVGPREDDGRDHPNSPETILTESYKLTFEGKTLSTSSDGRVVTVPHIQGEPAVVGSVFSILSGPQAGEWRRVVWPLGPHMFLLDKPVALGGGAVSVQLGFTKTVFDRNSIDARGSHIAIPFVLCGQHFGTVLSGNHTYGGSDAFMIFASASEAPVYWGWSHNPMLGLVFDGNTFEDAWTGALLGICNEAPIRWTRGRVYMTATLQNNTFVWSDAFLSAFAKAKRGEKPVAIKVGWKPSGNPSEFIVNEHGNKQVGGGGIPSMKVHMTTLNGQAIKDANVTFSTGEARATAGARQTVPATRR